MGTNDTTTNQANASPDNNGQERILNALRQLGEGIVELNERFDKKISNDEAALFSLKDLNNRLSMYENNFHFSIIKPIIIELIDLREGVKKTSAPKDGKYEILPQTAQLLIRSIDLILEKNSIFPYAERADIFNAERQRILETVPAQDPAQRGKIAERVTDGYYYKDRYKSTIIRFETVKVYK